MVAPNTTKINSAPWALVNAASRSVLLEDLRGLLAQGKGFSIATLNLDHVVKLRTDTNFQKAYAAQTHVTADGRPIVWLSALSGHPVDLITGSDLVRPFVELCAEQHIPIAVLGSTQDILDRAAAQLEAHHTGLKVVARLAPPMGFDPNGSGADAMISELAESGAKVCLLALGAPKQETFSAHASRSLPDMGFVSIGAGLDFVAGAQTRAPIFFRRFALEWLWRLLTNPKRLAWRYAQCFAVLPGLAIRALRMRFFGEIRKAS